MNLYPLHMSKRKDIRRKLKALGVCRKIILIVDYFMNWGLDFENCRDASCSFSVAIIELDDGIVKLVPVENIKFI